MIYLKNFFLNQNIFNIVAFGFLIRALTLIFYGNPLFGDTETHRLIGTEIFNGNIVTSSIHMPGYGVYMYLSNLIININHPTIKREPPIGVIIPSHLTLVIAIK